jgi:uncharacterized protein
MAVQPTPPASGVVPDDPTRAFWAGGAHNQLLITRCSACPRLVHPPRASCQQCGAPLTPEPVSGAGVVFTYTVNHQQFHPDVAPPYVIALVELVDQPGLRLAANIVDCDPDSVHAGMPVQVRFEVRGSRFVPAFAPAAVEQAGAENS